MQSRLWQPLFQPDENTLLLSALDGSENPLVFNYCINIHLANMICSTFCYTIRELTMLALINELTDMPDWDRKIFDSDFTFEWKSAKTMSGNDMTRSMVDWVR